MVYTIGLEMIEDHTLLLVEIGKRMPFSEMGLIEKRAAEVCHASRDRKNKNGEEE